MRHRIPEGPFFDGLRVSVLERDGRTCKMCGLGVNDASPYDGGPVRLTVGLIVPRDRGGSYSADNARALCGDCAEGLDRVAFVERPSARLLLTQLRRATRADQVAVLRRLVQKFPEQATRAVVWQSKRRAKECSPGGWLGS